MLAIRVLDRVLVEAIGLEFSQPGHVHGNQVLELDELLAAGQHFPHEMHCGLIEGRHVVLAYHSEDLPEVALATHVLVQVL